RVMSVQLREKLLIPQPPQVSRDLAPPVHEFGERGGHVGRWIARLDARVEVAVERLVPDDVRGPQLLAARSDAVVHPAPDEIDAQRAEEPIEVGLLAFPG